MPTSDLLWIEGATRVEGDVRLIGGALEWRDAKAEDRGIPLRAERVDDPAAPKATLRVVIGKAEQGDNKLSVGPVVGGNFSERFTANDKGEFGRPGGNAVLQLFGSRIADVGTGILSLKSGGHVVAFDDTDDKVGINTTQPKRRLHVEGTEIHSGGADAGFSFGNRQTAGFVEHPAAGERWVWYASNGAALLWSGGNKLAVTPAGNVGIGTIAPTLKLQVEGDFGNPDSAATLHLWGATLGDRGGNILFIRASSPGVVAFDGPGDRVGIGTTTPQAKLEVRGDIRLDPNGSLFAPGGVENLRMLRGNVNANGTIADGQGFTVNHVSAGRYQINFSNPFPGRPSVSATQVFPTFASFGGAGDTRDNAVVGGISATGVEVNTGENDGDHEDRAFSFIVVGPR